MYMDLRKDHIDYWRERLIDHHASPENAVDAQIRHIMAELGEAMREYADWNGDNPRRPEGMPEARDKFLDELCDVVITTLITLEITSNCNSRIHAVNGMPHALSLVMERLDYVTERMQHYDNVHNHV